MRLATASDRSKPKLIIQIVDRSKLRKRLRRGEQCSASLTVCDFASVAQARKELCQMIDAQNVKESLPTST